LHRLLAFEKRQAHEVILQVRNMCFTQSLKSPEVPAFWLIKYKGVDDVVLEYFWQHGCFR
jgi:hypothetical protein